MCDRRRKQEEEEEEANSEDSRFSVSGVVESTCGTWKLVIITISRIVQCGVSVKYSAILSGQQEERLQSGGRIVGTCRKDRVCMLDSQRRITNITSNNNKTSKNNYV